MANQTGSQNFKNHAKFAPPFHFLGVPLLVAYAVWAIMGAVKNPTWGTVMPALLGVALVLLIFMLRLFVLTVQDRVIRLEMRLRMRDLLPPDLIPRIPEFTPGQLVALRFASDRELPALARRVLDDRIQDRKTIKKMVTDWQADHLRA
jgi:hypothetical protein